MDFSEEIAYLIKEDGTRIQIMAEIGTNTAYISDINTPIQFGDLLERPRGSVTDTYEVLNVLPWSKSANSLGLIPPHIQAQIKPYRKQRNCLDSSLNVGGSINASTFVFNSGKNAAINVNTNYDNFRDLLGVIEGMSAPKEIVDSVKDLEANVGKSTFKSKYNDFVASLADHVTVLQAVMPFLPWLSNM